MPVNLPRRFPLAATPTPLQRAPRLERAVGGGRIWLKRDDLTGLGLAGNKARPLEYLIGDAVARRAEVLVVAGSPHSNFCAAAALAARLAGIECEVIHSGAAPDEPPTTMRLSRAAGARLRFEPGAARDELDELVRRRAADMRAAGRRPYAVPRGGATAVGCVGFALAAEEVAKQCAQAGITTGTVVLPTGSGGSQAGLLAGCARFGLPLRVVGASVSRPADEIRSRVHALAQECADLLGWPPPAAVEMRDVVGPGFGLAGAADRESAHIAFDAAGLLLDDSYGAKAMTVLRALAATEPGPHVFWCTGGIPSALQTLQE